MKKKFYLAHLYPDYLNFPGDSDNPNFLKRRAIETGLEFAIDHLTIGDLFDPEKYDFVFIGGGADSAQRKVSDDLIKIKGVSLRQAIEGGVVMLCICGGYQLMGQRYVDLEGYEMKGLGVLDLETIAEPERIAGDLQFEADLPLVDRILSGIEEHAGRTYLGKNVKPLGRVIQGSGNNGLDKTEGVQYKNLIGTYAHGGFLPNNPQIADYLIKLAKQRQGFAMP